MKLVTDSEQLATEGRIDKAIQDSSTNTPAKY
jgi:hypothetical protein